MTPTSVERAAAVEAIGARLAAADSFVIGAPPDTIGPLADALDLLPSEWTAYLDNDHAVVASTDTATLRIAEALVGRITAVVIVPKTVPTQTLEAALGVAIPCDGTAGDIVLLHAERNADGAMLWPTLFVDGIDVFDPATAKQLRALGRPA